MLESIDSVTLRYSLQSTVVHSKYLWEWLQCHQDSTGTVDAVVPSVAGLSTCSKPQLPSAGVAQQAALQAATPVTRVRILSVLETCMRNFQWECRGKYHGCGDKISDNPAGWEFNCWKSRGSGRKNREPTTGRTLEECRTQLSADSLDSLLFLHSAFGDKF